MKKRITFWQHLAISLSIVAGMLAANFKTNAAESPNIAAVAISALEFNHQSRHFIMLDQPDWLTARISRALQE